MSKEKRKIERIEIYYEGGCERLVIYPEDIEKASEWVRVRRLLEDLKRLEVR